MHLKTMVMVVMMVVIMMMVNYLTPLSPLSFLSCGSNRLEPAAQWPGPSLKDPEGVPGRWTSALRCFLLPKGILWMLQKGGFFLTIHPGKARRRPQLWEGGTKLVALQGNLAYSNLSWMFSKTYGNDRCPWLQGKKLGVQSPASEAGPRKRGRGIPSDDGEGWKAPWTGRG